MEDKTLMGFISLGIILVFGGFFLFLNPNDAENNLELPIESDSVDLSIEGDYEILNSLDLDELDLMLVSPPSKFTETESLAGSDEVNLIIITSSGFFPSDLTIGMGGVVIFVNLDSSQAWPASNIHPSHKSYPGSSISKCGSSEENEIFDSCRGLEFRETYNFTFNEVGSWKYHDHLKPSSGGTIIVA